MGFKTLDLLVALAVLTKGIAGLVMPERFYAWRGRQFLAARVPGVLLITPVYFAMLAALGWSATLVHFEAGGCLLAALLTLGVLLGAANLSRWETYRIGAQRAAANRAGCRRWDAIMVGVGAMLLALAVFVS